MYLSYNAQPGFAPVAGLREVLLAEIAHLADPRERAAHIERLLPVLEAAFAAEQTPHAALMRDVVAELRGKPIALVMHDELEVVNDPRTFDGRSVLSVYRRPRERNPGRDPAKCRYFPNPHVISPVRRPGLQSRPAVKW